MTATCGEACCSVTSRRTVSELFERGFRRNRAAPLPIEGAQLTDAEGNAASFSLDVVDGQVASLGFRATTCPSSRRTGTAPTWSACSSSRTTTMCWWTAIRSAPASPRWRRRRDAADGLRPVLLRARDRRQAVSRRPIGCFPDLYKALAGNMPEQMITL